MSVHTWGESPQGLWHLEVHNEGRYMAKLTQWDLLFHGTQEPPQESDVEFSKDSKFKDSKSVQYSANGGSNYPDGLEHNSLETDTASGQWRDLHHVREGHIDVQRTASDDVTSSACISYNDNHNCLECMPDTYLFEGHCYTNCPAKSFLSAKPTWLPATRNHNKKHLLENLWSSLAARNGHRVQRQVEEINRNSDMMVCLHCHYSCLTCRGPNDHECSTCNEDAVLTNKTNNENFCYPLTIMPQIQDSAWFYRLYVTLIVVISIILGVIACSGLVYILNKCINKILYLVRSSKGQKYDKVASQDVTSAQIDMADDNLNSVDESENEF
ncbi:furin-like protease 1 [Ctenocephalides felis]|nr:furin-like protease 1 [Ctenocephalides felis]